MRKPLIEVKRSAKNTMLCWNPGTSEVECVPWPDYPGGRSDDFQMTALACYNKVKIGDFEFRKLVVFVEAMHLIIRDRCDPDAVHAALLQLEEYRDGLSTDMPGSRRP